MDAKKLVLPAAVFVGGALLGRIIGLRGLLRAGMAAVTVANMTETAGLLTAAGQAVAQPKPPAKRTRRSAAGKKAAAARAAKRTHSTAASARTH